MKTLRLLILAVTLMIGTNLNAQLVFNNGGIMVINDCYLVINDIDTAGIVQTGTGGLIITDDENDIVKWNLFYGTGQFVVPFGTASLAQIPFTADITSAGFAFSGTPHYLFKTYPTGVGNTPWPTGVTGINHVSGSNDSAYMADRYWVIDQVGYTIAPEANYTFTYEDPEDIKVGNTITEANLRTQYWTGSYWDWKPKGSGDPSANEVKVDNVTWSAPWVLVDYTHPLPVELTYFDAEWNNKQHTEVRTFWETATEIDNDHFDVERSTDGVNFVKIGEVASKGASTTTQNYEFMDTDPVKGGISYYRLKQVDIDGTFEYSHIVVLADDTEITEVVNVWPNPTTDRINVLVNATEAETAAIYLFGVDGRLFQTYDVNFEEGANVMEINTSSLASGEYFINIVLTNNEVRTKSFLIQR